MKVLDAHIHVLGQARPDPKCFASALKAAGADGAVVLSVPPGSFRRLGPPRSVDERLDNLFAWCDSDAELYPFFWIDPVEDGAVAQVGRAVERGVAGFKIICNHFRVGEEKSLRTLRAVAAAGRPILFHSGILWDGDVSSQYNRPVEFEALLEVERLRFALAHISWPWVDECIAVYGKYLSARRRRAGMPVEMFIDTTPGTPPIYRRDALSKLFGVGYNLERNVLFGTDSRTGDNLDGVRKWAERDAGIYRDLGLSPSVQRGIFAGNLRRFVGPWRR